MTTKQLIKHHEKYFRHIDQFHPNTPSNGQKNLLPEPLYSFLKETLKNIKKECIQSEYTPIYLQHSKSAILIYEDSEIEAVADNAHFHELILFYDDQPCVKADSIIKELVNNKDDWYVISASSPEGAVVINNYVIGGFDLMVMIILLAKITTKKPIQELLAYRTSTLYDSLILACSKPF